MGLNENKRIISTPSSYAKDNLMYVQEIGTLTSRSPHISTRNNLYSFLFLTVINGSGSFSYCGNTQTLAPGDCVFINCENPYSHESSEHDPWTLAWVHFYGANINKLYERFFEKSMEYVFHPTNNEEALLTLNVLYDTIERNDSNTEILCNKYLTDIITYSFTCINASPVYNYSIKEKLMEIREYIGKHYSEKISLDHLADKFYISKYHLVREYKRTFGTTIVNDINTIRISNAKSLLRFTSNSIESIALTCGFKDTGYFIKVFKESEGLTPLAFRKKW